MTGTSITLTGQLNEGTVAGSTRSVSLLRAPLPNMGLYCVTLAEPPVAASATSDANGNVSVTLDAGGLPLGCFLQEAGTPIATVIFVSGSMRGQTVTFGGNVALGSIAVDRMRGQAEATIPNGTIAQAPPPGASCPIGTWVLDTGLPSCATGTTLTQVTWVSKLPTGEYIVFNTTGPIMFGDGDCGYYSGNIPATYTNGKLTYEALGQACNRAYGTSITPDASCVNGAVELYQTNCESCTFTGGSSDCGACGTMRCSAPTSATRK